MGSDSMGSDSAGFGSGGSGSAGSRAPSVDDAVRQAVEAPPTRVVVIGGGMAGLVAARECARPGFLVTVVEASTQVGGCVASQVVGGVTVDAGAESFATRGGHVASLIDELGLTDLIVQPNPAGAWVRLPTGSVPLPRAGLLGIPSSPLATDVVRVIGWSGAWRAYLDRIMPVLKIGSERSLGVLVRKRMGTRVLERLVAPVTTGVYSAQPDDLEIAVVAPGLNGALTRLGSLSGAVAELRLSAKAGSAVGGLRGGMWRLAEALADTVRARGGSLITGVGVESIAHFDATGDAPAEDAGVALVEEVPTDASADAPAKDAVDNGDAAKWPDARWIVRLSDGSTLLADAVVVATPAASALGLLAAASTELKKLASLDWPTASSVELVTLVIDKPALGDAPRGTGVLVADLPGVGVTAKAMTHSTVKWDWLSECADGRHIVRLSYGRAGQESETLRLDDAALMRLALADASELLNIPIAESDVRGFGRTSWTNALPYAALGEKERIDRVRAAVGSVDGLEVAGSWLAGTGLASVVPDAKEAAHRVRGLRWKALTENL